MSKRPVAETFAGASLGLPIGALCVAIQMYGWAAPLVPSLVIVAGFLAPAIVGAAFARKRDRKPGWGTHARMGFVVTLATSAIVILMFQLAAHASGAGWFGLGIALLVAIVGAASLARA